MSNVLKADPPVRPKSTLKPALKLVKTLDLDRDQWLSVRKGGIGSSDAGAAVGLNPYKSPLELWLEKTGRDANLPKTDPNDETSPMYWGTLLEPIVAAHYTKRTGNKVRRVNAVLQHPSEPWMRANLDREIIGAPDVQILECKTAGMNGARLWKDGVPEYVQLQVMHQLAVTGKRAADVAVLICGQELQVHRIDRDEALIAQLVELERQFWRYVELDQAPPADGSDSADLALRCLYPQDSGHAIDLSDDLALSAAFSDLLAVRQLLTTNSQLEAQLKQRIQQRMGEATRALFEAGEVSWKRSKDGTGLDVALLIRRIQAQCARPAVYIGTSATIASGRTVAEQKAQIANVATTLFGRRFAVGQIISESLSRSLADGPAVPDAAALRASVLAGVDAGASFEVLKHHPLGKWLENRIALRMSEGDLVRGLPSKISDVISALSEDTDTGPDEAKEAIDRLLLWISQVNQKLQSEGQRNTVLPFKLHQFISQTGSVYTTLDQDENRFITLEPGVFKADEAAKKPIYPNVFSRASGHAFICVTRVGDHLEPREFRESSDEDEGAQDGYLIVGEDIWDDRDDLAFLPDSWLNRTRTAPDSRKRAYFPIRLGFDETGKCSDTKPMKWWGWFMKAPLLFDPTSGVFYDTKTNEGTKLTKLGSEGRSTSTTITTFSILNRLSDAAGHGLDRRCWKRGRLRCGHERGCQGGLVS